MTLSNFVAYVTQKWKNKPDTSTPLSAERLTHQEDGIKGNSDAIQELAAAVVSQIVNDPNKIASMAALYAANQKIGDTSKLPAGTTDVASAIAQLYSNLTVLNAKEIQFKPAIKPVFTSTNNLASGAETMFTVTFDKAFSAVPTITFTLRTNGDLFLSQVDSISTTGFTGYIRNPFPSAKPVSDVSLCYIAMC
jgi:phage-related protein